MQKYLRPALRHTALSAKAFASQVVVAVTTAVCVTVITNALLKEPATTADPSAVISQPAPVNPEVAITNASPGQYPVTPPELEVVTIRDVPAPLSRAPAPNFAEPAGLYYAQTGALTDPLELLDRSGT